MNKSKKIEAIEVVAVDQIEAMPGATLQELLALPMAQRIAESAKFYAGAQARAMQIKADGVKQAEDMWACAVIRHNAGVTFDALEQTNPEVKKLGSYRTTKSELLGAKKEGIPFSDIDGNPLGKVAVTQARKAKALGIDISGKTQAEAKKMFAEAAKEASGDVADDSGTIASGGAICDSSHAHRMMEPELYLYAAHFAAQVEKEYAALMLHRKISERAAEVAAQKKAA